MAKCAVETCTRAVYCKSWCKNHYERNRMYGSPVAPLRRSSKFDAEYDPEAGTKRCSGCKVVKSLSDYSPQVRGVAGCLAKCRPCAAEESLGRFHKRSDEEHLALDLRKFGITVEDYHRIEEAQGGVCAICRQPETVVLGEVVSRLSVDHDHRCCPTLPACGQCVRGLLCRKHNAGLGRFNDDIELLKEAINYLQFGGFEWKL